MALMFRYSPAEAVTYGTTKYSVVKQDLKNDKLQCEFFVDGQSKGLMWALSHTPAKDGEEVKAVIWDRTQLVKKSPRPPTLTKELKWTASKLQS